MSTQKRVGWVGLAGVTVLLFALSVTAWGENSRGTVCPYSATVEALKGPEVTDVYVTIHSEDPSFPVPASVKKLLLKSLDEEGEAQWAKNYRSVVLQDGVAQYQYDDLGRYQPVTVQVNLQTGLTVNNHVLRADTIVLLRPDLVISDVNAPSQVHVNELINLEVIAREVNLDLGAAFDVALYLQGNEVDRVQGANIDAGGAVSNILTTSFDTPGTYTVCALIENSDPAEFDDSNNWFEFELEVLPNAVPMYYILYYRRALWKYANWTHYDYSNIHSELKLSGQYECMHYTSCTTGKSIVWPIENVNVQVVADGVTRLDYQAQNLNPMSSSGEHDRFETHSRWLPGNTVLYIASRRNDRGWRSIRINVSHWAQARVHYSHNYGSYWSYSRSYSYRTGSLWNASQSLETNISLTDDGVTYGGWAQLPLWSEHHTHYRTSSGGSWWGSTGGYAWDDQMKSCGSGYTTD